MMRFHAPVVAHMAMAMIGISIGASICIFIVCYKNTTFACCSYFKKVERVTTCFTEQACGSSFIRSSKCLPSIFYKYQIMLFYYLHNGVHICHATAHMHQANSLCIWS